MRKPIRIGIGGPVGSGKTALLVELCRRMSQQYRIAAITNDIFTQEDAEYVRQWSGLAPNLVVGVETGGCPHTAIREDVSMNLHAVEDLVQTDRDLDIVFLESGGDNLAATFSPELVDSHIYVIDVAEGEEIPRKGGPGITKSPLLVINKIDLAPYVEVNLEVMRSDAARARGQRPTIFTDVKRGHGVTEVVHWVEQNAMLEPELRVTQKDTGEVDQY